MTGRNRRLSLAKVRGKRRQRFCQWCGSASDVVQDGAATFAELKATIFDAPVLYRVAVSPARIMCALPV